tara:strand:+ start:2111 stop:2776 length:666 start_codon:yes stop_codon:yes gene_type:complete
MKFEEYIKNKKVLIIGPASYLRDDPIIDAIDSFDTIIRVNSSIDLTLKIPDIVGSRTDIVFTTADIDVCTNTNHRKINMWVDKGVKHVRICPPAIRHYYSQNIKSFERENNKQLEFSVTDRKNYLEFVKKCEDTIPNTGLAAILDCLKYSPKIIHVSGITFFKGGYMKEYGVTTTTEKEVRKFFEKQGNHDIDKQIEYFKKIFADNKHLSCDDYIMEALEL